MAQQAKSEITLQQQAQLLERYLSIKDRKYNTKTYRNCFVGTDAVQKIIALRFACNPMDAVAFGNKLDRSNLICHVEQEHIFKNEALFYRYTPSYYANMDHSKSTLQEKARVLEHNLNIKNRRYKVSVYNNCFVGTDAIRKMIQLKLASNAAEAIQFGNALIDAHIVHHVEKEHKFKNEGLFYRFSDSYYQQKAKSDHFEFVGKKLKLKNDNRCAINASCSQQTAYGSHIVDCSSKEAADICHLWTLHIDKMDNNSCVAIGVDSVLMLESAFYQHKAPNIAFRSDGNIFSNGLIRASDVKYSFDQGDIIRIELNVKDRVIEFYRNYTLFMYEKIAIKPGKYRLAVYLLGDKHSVSVTIEDYRTITGDAFANTGNLFKDTKQYVLESSEAKNDE